MTTAKEHAHALIDDFPDDASFEEIVKELAFHGMIERGLDDSLNNRVISDEELEKEIQKW